jgi:two-component system sensor histidine kinase HydH
MKRGLRGLPGYTPAVLAMLLPVILLYSSVRTFYELDQMKAVYLRNRSAAIAAKLETLAAPDPEQLRRVADDEPGALDITIISEQEDATLADLWAGRELFRTELMFARGKQVFRSHVPFHTAGRLRIARIDLDSSAADFLLVHARHNVATAAVSGAVLLLLASYAIWSIRRSAAAEKRNLELAHLAHLGKLSAVLAHEIRTPLATIKGFTQLALEHTEKSAAAMLFPVVVETQRLERLVNDLLLYGRPPQPMLRDCSWKEIAESSGTGAAEVTVEKSPLRLHTDPDILRQIVSNLTRNAAEAVAGRPDGWVRVSISASGDAVALLVEDNGPGIPASEREKVFESFFTTKSYGTGLGLPIARNLTHALGGELVLRDREGDGLRVEVRLPAGSLRAHSDEVTV